MKFSVRQIIASAAGAVVAATIASLFGVNGTIIGVAIGSAVATFGTAFISQSIERGHEAVKQVAVRVPDRTALLRRMGGTSTSGDAEPPTVESSALTEETASAATVPTPPVDDTAVMATEPPADDPTVTMWAPGLPHEPPATDEVPLLTASTHQESEPDSTPRGMPWKAISATAAIVFVLSLGTVTVIELIAGHPLSDLFNNNKSNAPTIGQLVNPPATTTTTTSTSTTSTTSTTTTSTSTTTTSTTVPGGSTTTTAPTQGSSTTTTTGLNAGTTTTIP